MKGIKQVYLGLMALAMGLLVLFSFLGRRQAVSVNENRTLKAHPEFSAQAVWDGSYFDGWDEYFADHVARRDDMMQAYLWLQLYVKRCPVVNEVVITDRVLLPELDYWDYSGFDYATPAAAAADRLAALQAQVEAQGAGFLYLGVQEQRTAFSGEYPTWLDNREEYYGGIEAAFAAAAADRGVHTLFLADELAGEDPLTYYYRVDHHYNLLGAHRAYLAMCRALGAEVPTLGAEQLVLSDLPGEFYGAYSRKFYGLSPIRETLQVFDTAVLPPYERWDNGQRTDAPVLALPAAWVQPQYNVFMGGDQAETVIQTHRPSLPSILIVGDSFTNPVEALCVYSFNEVRSLDYRHYTDMTLTDYLRAHPVDYVVVIRDNLNYFGTEGNGDLR